eukprot:5390879-Amphidinium_carterae.2
MKRQDKDPGRTGNLQSLVPWLNKTKEQDMNVVILSQPFPSHPREGQCQECGSAKGIACEHEGCDQVTCMVEHCRAFRDENCNAAQVWCQNHPGEQPGKDTQEECLQVSVG